MCAHRLWPAVQTIGRGLITNRNEIFQQGVRAYNVQNFNNGYLGGQGHHQQQQQQNVVSCHDNLPWTNRIANSAKGTFCGVVSRPLHSGNTLLVRDYPDLENEHAHDILRSLPAYSTTTVGKDIPNGRSYQHPMYCSGVNWEDCSAQEVADGFIAMSQLCHHQPMNIEDLQYSALCCELTKKLGELNDEQLLKVLSSLALWPATSATTTPNFVGLWNSLDQLCTMRMKAWNISQMFLVADHWYALKLSRISMYNVQMTKVLGKKIATMEPYQLVQYLFYANLSRKLEPFIVMKELEKRLTEVLEHVSIEELGVMAMGVFKTQTFLKSEKLIDAIISKTEENLEFVSDPSLCAILKILRKSIPGTRWKSLSNLLDSIEPHLDRLNTMCLLQVSLLGTNLLVFHENVIDKIALRFSQDIKGLRLKDLERFTFVLMLFNFTPRSCPDICVKIAEELKQPVRREEINLYPKSFVSCVVYLMNMGIFTPDLISAALQPSMLKLLDYSHHYSDMGREVNELDWSLEIEGPAGYPGYRLDPKRRRELTDKYLARIPVPSKLGKDLTHQEKLLLEVQTKLGAMLGGTHFVAVTNILPHMQTPDLVFCTSREGEPIELPSEFLEHEPTEVKYPCNSDDELYWNAVIIGGRNSFIRNTYHLQGNVQMKKRQLSCLGYHVSVVPHMDYIRKSLRVKLACLERVLKEGSTLTPSDGRIASAFVNIKGEAIRREEM